MKKEKETRRKFIKQSMSSAAGLLALTALPKVKANSGELKKVGPATIRRNNMDQAARIRFAVIGINHDHIHGQIGAITRGGGEFVSFYAKEPELAAAFAKRYPQVKQARSQDEILEDKSIQLVL